MAAYTTIDDPSAYFKVQLYTGNGTAIGSNGKVVTFDDTDTDMQPDLVWIKDREDTYSHVLTNSVSGATKYLNSNGTAVETTNTETLTAFGSDGFTVGNFAGVNINTTTYVAWCWKESAAAGFDIVTYTGNGTDDTDISHNLSAVPKMIIIKNLSAADAWQVYHGANTAAPETDYLVLDTAAAGADSADRWSDEAPTSSVFTLGDGDEVNTNTENYIAYCFAEKQGYSKMGTYVANDDTTAKPNNDATFIYTGFKPRFIMTKRIDGTSEWAIFDTKRTTSTYTHNPMYNILFADSNQAENQTEPIDVYSNGWKPRADSGWYHYPADSTWVYYAVAEAPFVNSKGVPCNAR